MSAACGRGTEFDVFLLLGRMIAGALLSRGSNHRRLLSLRLENNFKAKVNLTFGIKKYYPFSRVFFLSLAQGLRETMIWSDYCPFYLIKCERLGKIFLRFHFGKLSNHSCLVNSH
jgi:hypothetical protein